MTTTLAGPNGSTAVPDAAEPAAASAASAVEPAATAAASAVEPAVPAAAPVLTFDQPTAAYELIVAAPAPPADGTVSVLAGEVAVEVAHQLAEPVRALRDRLGLVVDHLERHVANSTGPSPYPWRSLQALRQD